MNKKVRLFLFVISILLSSSSVSANQTSQTDSQSYVHALDDISTLMRQGNYEAALEKKLSTFEESRAHFTFSAVRLTFGLSLWYELGTKYPKALEALKQLQASNEKTLLLGNGDVEVFNEYHAINRVLSEEKRTTKTFLTLNSQYPEQAKNYFSIAKEGLIIEKHYQIASQYIEDSIMEYEEVRYERERILSHMRKSNELGGVEHINQRYIFKVRQLIAVLAATDRDEEKRIILERASYYYGFDEITKT